MHPDHPRLAAPTLAEEAESLANAIYQGDNERRDRKAKELIHALSQQWWAE